MVRPPGRRMIHVLLKSLPEGLGGWGGLDMAPVAGHRLPFKAHILYKYSLTPGYYRVTLR